ncbi:MAG: hypothetical protein MRY23_04795 [Pelagibacteraceae bacterium]|nr:hypothetical protein [Pelagibacteraceae bacterium]MCI5079104.1 hypothetical protein [Pelagibacteraceae bacterium]
MSDMLKKFNLRQYLINFIIINLLFFPIAFYQFERPFISLESFIFALSGKLLIFGFVYEAIVVFFSSLQITPELIFFSFWLNNLNFDFISTFTESYTLAILLIIICIFYRYHPKLKLSVRLTRCIKALLIFCIILVTLLILNRPMIKWYFNDVSDIKKIGSITLNLIHNVNYQSSIRNDLISSDFLNEKFDINSVQLKKFNKIYIVVMESYPLFVDSNIRNKLNNFLLNDLDKYKVKKQYKNWYPDLSTLGQEFYMFCGKVPGNLSVILDAKDNLNDIFDQNDCLIHQLKKEGFKINFIHSFKSDFNNRTKYKTYFDKSYFFNDLLNKKFEPKCNWYEPGICDYEILERFDDLFDLNQNQTLYYFLTLNGHVIPQDYFIKNKSEKEDCSHPALNSNLMCKVYNNQIQFNKSLNTFIKKNLKRNEIVIAIGDTPPYFLQKSMKKLVINDYVPVYVIEKK